MQSSVFYQKGSTEQAVRIFVVSKSAFEAGLPELNVLEKGILNNQQFMGKPGDVCLIYNAQGVPEKAFVGSGDDHEALAIAHASSRLPAGCYCLENKVSSYALAVWSLAQYRFDAYKKAQCTPRVLILDEGDYETVKRDTEALFLVRDLINQPANQMGPRQLSEAAASLALKYNAEFKEWVGDELLKAHFPAVHMVGRASAQAPRLLSLTWGNTHHPKVALVGKGVCFDSGGLDIKPSSGMRLMKKDMGGAAHVLGLAQWIMEASLPIYLQVLIPAVENAVGPDAFRPGDVIAMRNGLTVEVDNTDAEGRLVLADACAFAAEFEPELVIDFATLTGAARVAVGTDIAAMFCNNDELAADLMKASEATKDPVWRLPLFSAYEPQLDSTIADISNCSVSPFAGAITAALFIKKFLPAHIPWVHFDIMAWNWSSKPGKPEGGEALGLRAVAYYLQQKYSQGSHS